MATLTNLLVKMGLETASLRRDLNRSRRDFRNYSRDTRRELSAINTGFTDLRRGIRGVGGALAALGLGNIVGEQIRLGSETAKFARTLGTTTENLSSLTFVAARSNVEFRTLTQLLQRQTRRIGEAARGYGEARNVLRELNLDAANLSNLDSIDVFRLLAPVLRDARNEAEALRIATKLFDTEGAQAALRLVENLEQVEQQAREVGAVLDTQVARALEDLEDGFTNLKTRSADFFRTSIAGYVILAQKAAAFGKAALSSDAQTPLQQVQDEITRVQAEFDRFQQELSSFSESDRNSFNSRAFDRDTQELRRLVLDRFRQLSELRERQAQLLAASAGGALNGPRQLAADTAAATAGLSGPALQESQRKSSARLRSILREFNAANADLDALVRASQERQREAAERQAEVDAANAVIERLRFSTLDAQGQIAASLASDLSALREAAQRVGLAKQELQALETALSNAAVASIRDVSDTANEALETADQFAQQLQTVADQAARNMQDAFADFLFDPFEDGLKGMVSSFVDTLRRMAAEAAAAQIFQAIGGSSGGLGNIFRTVVGAASGAGAVTGSGTLVTPGIGDKTGLGGSGKSGITINQTIDARGADPTLAARLPAILEASSRATEARIYSNIQRGLVPA